MICFKHEYHWPGVLLLKFCNFGPLKIRVCWFSLLFVLNYSVQLIYQECLKAFKFADSGWYTCQFFSILLLNLYLRLSVFQSWSQYQILWLSILWSPSKSQSWPLEMTTRLLKFQSQCWSPVWYFQYFSHGLCLNVETLEIVVLVCVSKVLHWSRYSKTRVASYPNMALIFEVWLLYLLGIYLLRKMW